MWKAISKATARSGKPFLWGGDWNVSPAEVQEILASMNIPGVVVAPKMSTCVTTNGGSVIDFFVTHRKLAPWCQEAQVFKEGYTAPHRPVNMFIKGQQVQGLVAVHKRPPALKELMGHGPFRVFDDKLTAVSHEVTSFLNEFGINGECSNKAQHMTVEVNIRLTALFKS
jgi:hypothetical protein